MMGNEVVVLAGGNLGKVEEVFQQAQTALESLIGSGFAVSPIYESEAWGMENAPPFLNQAWRFNTSLTPEALMLLLLMVERDLGRIRQEGRGYTNRSIDLDILLVDDRVQTEGVMLPHPRLALRKFALLPLRDVYPEWVHPVLQTGLDELIAQCPDVGLVKKR